MSIAVVGVASFLVSLALWLYSPDARIPLAMVVPVGTIVLVLLSIAVAVLFHTAYEANREAHEARQSLVTFMAEHEQMRSEYEDYKQRGGGAVPKVIEGMDPLLGTQATLQCVLAPSELFYREMGVSFFVVNPRGVEALAGVGVVTNVQSNNGLILVTMDVVIPGHEGFAERLRQNEGEARRATLVKPGVSRSYLVGLTQEPSQQREF